MPTEDSLSAYGDETYRYTADRGIFAAPAKAASCRRFAVTLSACHIGSQKQCKVVFRLIRRAHSGGIKCVSPASNAECALERLTPQLSGPTAMRLVAPIAYGGPAEAQLFGRWCHWRVSTLRDSRVFVGECCGPEKNDGFVQR